MNFFEKTDNQIFVFVMWCELLITLLIWGGLLHPSALLGSIPAGFLGILYRTAIPIIIQSTMRALERKRPAE